MLPCSKNCFTCSGLKRPVCLVFAVLAVLAAISCFPFPAPRLEAGAVWLPVQGIESLRERSAKSTLYFTVPSDCKVCASRSLCNRSKSGAREIGLRPKEQYLALQTARSRQQTPEFKEGYHTRAGIEGTLSQGIQACGLRRSRYVGVAKTHLQNTAIATSLNVMRMVAWLLEVPLAKTRKGRFSILCARSAVPA